jgi:hypothetical protein
LNGAGIGEWQHAGSLFRFCDGGTWEVTPAAGDTCSCDTCVAGCETWRGDRRQEIVLIGPDLQAAKIVELLDECLLTPDEMVARTPSGSAVEPPAENWWAGVSGAGDFPVWEGSEAAAKRAAADAEALQADAFDALMDAQDAGAGDAAAAEAAKQAQLRADAAKARAAELSSKVGAAGAGSVVDSGGGSGGGKPAMATGAGATASAAPAPGPRPRKSSGGGGGGCCGSRPK